MLVAVTMWVLLGTGSYLPVFEEPEHCREALQKVWMQHPAARCVLIKMYGYV